ncbi:MAG: hypothetical protein ACC645_06015 [Pirellulales bacterium]
METLFLACAVFGGVMMVLQFLLTAMGVGDHGADADGFADTGNFGDAGHIGDAGRIGGDAHIGDVNATGGIGDADVEDGHVHWTEAAGVDTDHISPSRVFAVLSLRTVVAALAFFGLGGWTSLASGFSPVASFAIALGCGAAAMYAVYTLMRAIYGLRSEGNIHIRGAVGLAATVYVPVPANHHGAGKIQLNLQNRTVEYQAMTDEEEKLPTGARVVVTRVLGPDTVEVEPLTTADGGADA